MTKHIYTGKVIDLLGELNEEDIRSITIDFDGTVLNIEFWPASLRVNIDELLASLPKADA